MTTPSTLAITATNAPFHKPTRLGKDSYRQHFQSQVTLKNIVYRDVLYYIFIFNHEKAQPGMKGLKLKNFHNLMELLSPKNDGMETQSLCFQKQTL